ncbi:MAG TPA: peroxiredoxin family protein [Draconibacterium sp.]|nr:peroxiredoxin family protein [Draconibacterium sp.]
MKFQSILETEREREGGYTPLVLTQINDANNNRVEVIIPEVGDEAIDFALPNEDGSRVCLSELLKTGPVILNFFRGNFCEFCQLEMKAMHRSNNEFKRYNATLVGIAPAFVSIDSLGAKDSADYTYSILSDVGNKVAASYGLRYKVSEELENMFIAMGLELNNAFGESDENTLSIPATFVINTDRKIIFKFADTDYTKRAEPADIIASLISISKP